MLYSKNLSWKCWNCQPSLIMFTWCNRNKNGGKSVVSTNQTEDEYLWIYLCQARATPCLVLWEARVTVSYFQLLSKPKFSLVEKIKTIGSTYMAASGISPIGEDVFKYFIQSHSSQILFCWKKTIICFEKLFFCWKTLELNPPSDSSTFPILHSDFHANSQTVAPSGKNCISL